MWILLSELLTEDILCRWHPISPCFSRSFQYRCKRIPACNTLDPYLAVPIWQTSILPPSLPLAVRDTPGLEGMRRYHWLSSEIWGKRGDALRSICRDWFQIFLRGGITYCVGGVKRALCRYLLPGPRELLSTPVIQPRACTHESQRARNQLASAQSRIVLTHSLLSASDWQSLWVEQIHLNVKRRRPLTLSEAEAASTGGMFTATNNFLLAFNSVCRCASVTLQKTHIECQKWET